MKRILLATDGSDSATEALAVAIELARDTGAALTVLAVTVPLPVTRGGAVPIHDIETAPGTAEIAEAAAAKARAAGVEVHPARSQGDPAGEIARIAVEIGADLVVVGSHGYGAIRGTLFGSVSRALMRSCPVPVTIVKSAVHEPVPA